jgi:uncharacterized membrane protein YkvA (DUF1232 family)
MKDNQIKTYSKHYDSKSLFSKIIGFGKFLGKGIVGKILVLYYVFKDEQTPDWVKAIITGALGYLILPADLIPDLIPIAGFSDDIATIFASIQMISSYIKPEHKYFSKLTTDEIFDKKKS